MTLEKAFSKAVKFMKKEIHDLCQGFSDAMIAVHNPRVLKPSSRHLYEAKVIAGTAALFGGAFIFNPLIAGGGAVSIWEGTHDLAAAGHKWRVAHAQARAPSRRL